MKSIFLLLLIFVTCNCFGQHQVDPQVKQFLNEFVHNKEKKGNLYFQAYVHPELIDRIVRSLDYRRNDSVYRDPDNRKVAFELFPEEKEQIKKVWLSQKSKAWDSNLIENARIFIEKPIPGNFTREQRLEFLQQFEGKHIIQFSMPVFLRNNTLCIFFYESFGGGTIYIMKKENQKWVKFLVRTIFVS